GGGVSELEASNGESELLSVCGGDG
ncbi:hypothetical protein A2U01_0097703, partial [Trifolium medium]|nr:hypothetical protein [Trifolium medium]